MPKTDLDKVWDKMAKDDFFYRIPRSGDREEIGRWLDEARQMVEAFTAGFFAEQSFQPQDKTALEIGCGAGRQTYWLAKTFANVHAVDVSEEMLKNAQYFNAAVGNVVWSQVNGTDLAPLADGYFDFVYSFAVFKHIPSKEIFRQLLREVARVLKPDGIFKIDIACHPTGTRKVFGVPLVPRGLIHGLPHPIRFALFALLGLARRQTFRALSAHPATLGVRWSPGELPGLFASAGLALHGVEQIKLPMSMYQGGAFFATSHELDEHFSNRFWCTGKRV